MDIIVISFLAKAFIKDHQNISDKKVRSAYGVLCSVTGIFLNILLFAGKYIAGAVSGSIAIIADAFNNLSDAGSSVITLVGFKLADKEPDTSHPFGHGRMEYITGFIVSMLIILMGFELGKSSVEKILHPAAVETSILSFTILAASILVKAYMAFYNSRIGKKINSAAMKATAADSLSDVVATTVVLLSMIVLKITGISIDGWCGIAVSLFIFKAGISAARETLSPLLGQPPEPEFVKEIEDIVMAHDEIIGMHDLIVHDYGPGRVMISLHGEVDRNGDISVLHDTIDLIERELKDKLGCISVIHMDPIATDDKRVTQFKQNISEHVKKMNKGMSIHDFRIVPGPTHTNVIFDVCVPHDCKMSDEEITSQLSMFVSQLGDNFYAVITVDKYYV